MKRAFITLAFILFSTVAFAQFSFFFGGGANLSGIRTAKGFAGDFGGKTLPQLSLVAQYRFTNPEKLAVEFEYSPQSQGYTQTVNGRTADVDFFAFALGFNGRYFLQEAISVETGFAWQVLSDATIDFPRVSSDVTYDFTNGFAIHAGARFFENRKLSAGFRYSFGLRNILPLPIIKEDGSISSETTTLIPHYFQINLRYKFAEL